MSQQGTPLGAITLLNQARTSGGTFSNWPLSKAKAMLAQAAEPIMTMPSAIPRIRPSFRTHMPRCGTVASRSRNGSI